MSEQNTPESQDDKDGTAQDASKPQDGNGAQQASQSQDDAKDGGGQGDNDDDAGKGDDSETKKLKRENQRLRRERNAANDELEKARREKLSEAERAKEDADKAKAEADEAKAEARLVKLEVEVTKAASKLGFHDPADALALLPDGAVTIGENGSIEGVDDALAELAKAKPHLVNRSGGNAGGAFNPAGGQSANPQAETNVERARRLGLLPGGRGGPRVTFRDGGVVTSK